MTRKYFFSLIAAALGMRSGYSRPVEFDTVSLDGSFVTLTAGNYIHDGRTPFILACVRTGRWVDLVEAKSVTWTGNQAKVELLNGEIIVRRPHEVWDRKGFSPGEGFKIWSGSGLYATPGLAGRGFSSAVPDRTESSGNYV